MAIGAPNSYGSGIFVGGAVYLYEWDGAVWNETELLTASDGEAGDQFGISVSLSGDRLLVGAFGKDVLIGAAYLYECLGRAAGAARQPSVAP